MADDVPARCEHQTLAGLQLVERLLERIGLLAAVCRRKNRRIGEGGDLAEWATRIPMPGGWHRRGG
jgi:hypothetical protein